MRAPSLPRVGPGLVLAAGLVGWTALSVHLARSLWFFGDDFDFLLNRSVTLGGDHGLLVPHNEHWSTVPILLFRLDYAIFGMHHYLPYAIWPIMFHVLTCVLAFVLLRRCGAAPWAAALGGLVVLFTAGGAGAENTLWDFQVGFLGSSLFGMLAMVLHASDRPSRAARIVGAGALVLSLMSSGMGIVLVLWTAVFVAWRDGVRVAVMSVAVPVLVFLAWYATYGRGHTGAPPAELRVAPVAAIRGLGFIWSRATGIPGAGSVVLVGLVVVVVVARHRERLSALAGSGLVAVLGTYLLLGYSRSGIGTDATMRYRYVYFGVLLTVPALVAGVEALGRSMARRRGRAASVAWVAVAIAALCVGSVQSVGWAATRKALISDSPERIVAAAQVVRSGSPLLGTQPMPERNPDVTAVALARPSVRAALPDVKPSLRSELEVKAHLLVGVGTVGHSFVAPAAVRWRDFDEGGQPAALGSGCRTRTARAGGAIEVPPTGAPVELSVTVAGTDLGTRLVSGGQRSRVVHWVTRRGESFHVASSAWDATLRILVPAGDVTVCPGSTVTASSAG